MQPFFKLSLTLLLFISTSYGRILEPKESAKNNPGLQTSVDKATNSYLMHHTMLRIKDPKRSLDFYSRIMGMSLLKRFDFRELRFSTYLMGYEDTSTAPSDPLKRTAWAFRQNNIIELTHNWGTENNASFTGYHNGNTEPLGYGHVAINVDDVQKAIKRFDNLGVDFVMRPPNDKGIALFIRDPDGYWIEIFDIASVVQVTIDTNSA